MAQTLSALDGLRFEIEVSTRYHDYRRAALEFRVTVIRLVSLVGSVLALLSVSNWVESRELTIQFVTWISIVVGLFNLVDLVFHFDSSARTHTGLYQRFKALQGGIARDQKNWERLIPEWEADAQAIRIDEPGTFWATYALAWNQTAEKYQKEDHKRPLAKWQRWMRDWVRFTPDRFRAA